MPGSSGGGGETVDEDARRRITELERNLRIHVWLHIGHGVAVSMLAVAVIIQGVTR